MDAITDFLRFLCLLFLALYTTTGCRQVPDKQQDATETLNAPGPVQSVSIESDMRARSRPAPDSLLRILQKLHKTAVQFTGRTDVPCPELRIPYYDEMAIAEYWPGVIYVEQKTIDILHQQFQDDFEHAVAFVMAHELRHHFDNRQLRGMGFSNHLEQLNQSTQEELNADLAGTFWCYLAGYQVKSMVPRTFETLYLNYMIPAGQTQNYPSFEERKKSAVKIEALRDDLIDRYEAWSLLTAMGEHRAAAELLLPFDQYLRCPEISNKIGVSYLLDAICQDGQFQEDYYCPVIVHKDFPLSRAAYRGKNENLNILRHAITYFDRGLVQDTHDAVLINNKITALFYLCFNAQPVKIEVYNDFLNKNKQYLTLDQQWFFEQMVFALQSDQNNLRNGMEHLSLKTRNPFIKKYCEKNLNYLQTGKLDLDDTEINDPECPCKSALKSEDFQLVRPPINTRIGFEVKYQKKGTALKAYTIHTIYADGYPRQIDLMEQHCTTIDRDDKNSVEKAFFITDDGSCWIRNAEKVDNGCLMQLSYPGYKIKQIFQYQIKN